MLLQKVYHYYKCDSTKSKWKKIVINGLLFRCCLFAMLSRGTCVLVSITKKLIIFLKL